MSVIKAEVNLEASFDQPAFTLPGTTVITAMGVEYSTELFLGRPYVKSRSGSMAGLEIKIFRGR